MSEQERIEKYEVELKRLDDLHDELDVLWDHMPRYGWLALVSPVIWYLYGWGWGVVVLLVVASLVGTQAYLIGVRRSENRWTHQSVSNDLARLRAEIAARGAPSGEPRTVR